MQLFALNLWFAAYERGIPSTASYFHMIPYFTAIMCLHREVNLTALSSFPFEEPLQVSRQYSKTSPRETFSLPLDRAIRNRLYCTICSLYLILLIFLFSTWKHFSKPSCWLLGYNTPENSWHLVACWKQRWEISVNTS